MRTLAVSLAIACVACAADWPQWRGPNRDGKSAEAGLLKSWPAGGPKVVWKTEGLGEGYSTMSVAGGRIFTLGQRGDTQYVMALDAATGKKLWETPNGGPYRERRGDGPRSVPTVEGERLWAFSADGTLACLETKTGRKVWSLNVVDTFGGSIPHWGFSESPLIDGSRLYLATGGSGHAIVALDKNSGKLVWKSQSDRAGYSSPIAVDHGGTRILLALTGEAAVGLRADNGELLWRYKNVSNRTANVATPIFHNGHVFYSTAYGTGCALLKLDGSSSKEVYFNGDMMNHHATSILLGQHLYGFSNAILTAMNFMTGEVAWKDRSVGKGSAIYAEGHLYALSEDGVMGLVEANPKAYLEKSRFTLANRSARPTWAHPALSDGKLYIRDQNTLWAFDVKSN